MIQYSDLLKEYSLKVTPQRVAIVEELYMNGHMSIDDLYKKLLAKFPSVSLATIYKNINAMVEKLFLAEVKIPNAKSVYELTKPEHIHLRCTKCDDIIDLKCDTNELIKTVSKESGFDIVATHLVFDGVCSKCRN